MEISRETMKISISEVASYKEEACLETTKKTNLIYGLNGSGKTIISNFLKSINNDGCGTGDYSKCRLVDYDTEKILVYNQAYIDEAFYKPEIQKGIFTLSPENKDIEEKIEKHTDDLKKKQEEIESLKAPYEGNKKERGEIKKEANDNCWKIKGDYEESDLLDGFKNSKEKLFEKVLNTRKQKDKPEKDAKAIVDEYLLFSDYNASTDDIQPFDEIDADFQSIETAKLLEEKITGAADNAFSKIIEQLGNHAWVGKGLEEYIEEGEKCPFCQQEISDAIIQTIRSYFDETFRVKKQAIEQLHQKYKERIESIPTKEVIEKYKNTLLFKDIDFVDRLTKKNQNLKEKLGENLRKLADKISTPNQSVTLDTTLELITEINQHISEINTVINKHTKKLENVKEEREKLETAFWQAIRYDYDSVISWYQRKDEDLKTSMETRKNESKELKTEKDAITEKIKKLQSEALNIDGSIENINRHLKNLGLTGFSIGKHKDTTKYEIIRPSNQGNDKVFHSLSEGEKNIITFLYFIETCKGKEDTSETNAKKIIVIDDPVSSLSHIFVYNIAQFIKEIIPDAKRCFILTHSLYFFYELKKVLGGKLFRVQKKGGASCISEINDDEIRTDYEEYWSIVKDSSENKALVANCMRNIIEYFFSFIKSYKLNEVFEETAFKDNNKYASFKRWINRESHSDYKNLYDYNELDLALFKDAFKEIFVKSGHKEHYEIMMGKRESINV